jgi:hypothetical protein
MVQRKVVNGQLIFVRVRSAQKELTIDNWPLATGLQREGACPVWRQPPTGGNFIKEQHPCVT